MQTHLALLLSFSLCAIGTTARAQGPVSVGAPVGASALQQPSGASEPKADIGSVLPRASDDSGTTTSYLNDEPAKPVQWPCAQRKVPTISAGTIWSGPDLARGDQWEQDEKVAALSRQLASRRLPIAEADPLISAFAKQAGADKDKKLTELFVGVLDLINTNRSAILQGITRYAQGQERLAERMRSESDKISEAQENVQGPTGIAATGPNQDFAWDQRIFKERKQALSYVCETPSLLERRAFEIGKLIQAQLSPAKG